MSRLRHTDILVEMKDLALDMLTDIRQQLSYYRVSVYKDETSSKIEKKIEQLRLVAKLFGNEDIMEPLHDYDAMADAGVLNYVPGECSFSQRVSCLLTNLTKQLDIINPRSSVVNLPTRDIARSVQKHRRQLLALCRHGSRQWSFFQSL
jgi:hypothetical protein